MVVTKKVVWWSMLIVVKELGEYMNWFQSTNAKEIGTLYLIFAVFSGMIGTAFSVLVSLELIYPGVLSLQGDQLFIVLLFYLIASWSFFIYISFKYSLFTIQPHFKNILTILFKKK